MGSISSTAAAARISGKLTPSPTVSRVDQIDVLRGLSIIAVVIHHITLRIPLQKTAFGKLLPSAIVSELRWNGYNGVVVFFAISGFLITSNCFRRWKSLAGINVRQFYRMRFARIAPCLIALLAVLSVLHLLNVHWYTINPEHATLPRALVAALTFHVNWLEAHRGYLPANWDVLWSLSNEEIFYVFFPLVCLLTKTRVRLIAVLLAFVVVQPFARVLSPNEVWTDYGYLSCMGVIAIGCLAAIACDAFAITRRWRLAMKWTGAVLVAFIMLYRGPVLRSAVYKVGLDVPILAAGTALMLIAFTQGAKRGTVLSAPIRWFGRNSYEIYLTHMMVIFSLLPLAAAYDQAGRWVPLSYGAMLAGAGLLGALISRYFSEPMNRRLRSAGATTGISLKA